MEIGKQVIVNCNNKQLNGKIGMVILSEKNDGPIYGICVLIDGTLYGFLEEEIEELNE